MGVPTYLGHVSRSSGAVSVKTPTPLSGSGALIAYLVRATSGATITPPAGWTLLYDSGYFAMYFKNTSVGGDTWTSSSNYITITISCFQEPLKIVRQTTPAQAAPGGTTATFTDSLTLVGAAGCLYYCVGRRSGNYTAPTLTWGAGAPSTKVQSGQVIRSNTASHVVATAFQSTETFSEVAPTLTLTTSTQWDQTLTGILELSVLDSGPLVQRRHSSARQILDQLKVRSGGSVLPVKRAAVRKAGNTVPLI